MITKPTNKKYPISSRKHKCDICGRFLSDVERYTDLTVGYKYAPDVIELIRNDDSNCIYFIVHKSCVTPKTESILQSKFEKITKETKQ